MKRTHSLTPRSRHFCGRWGCRGPDCEKATEHVVRQRSQGRLVPGVGEGRAGGRCGWPPLS